LANNMLNQDLEEDLENMTANELNSIPDIREALSQNMLAVQKLNCGLSHMQEFMKDLKGSITEIGIRLRYNKFVITEFFYVYCGIFTGHHNSLMIILIQKIFKRGDHYPKGRHQIW